ncbi:MAG: phage tail protein [Clostridia bacterium]|nr:phage tail protein [Clostridia bacterium]
MKVGCLGDIEFYVADGDVRTLENFALKGSANYATHQRHGEKSLIEYVGSEPSTVSFDVVFSIYRGVKDPMGQINKLMKRMQAGKVMPLVVGTRNYGSYRWVIESMEVKAKFHDRRGDVAEAVCSMTLREYVRTGINM